MASWRAWQVVVVTVGSLVFSSDFVEAFAVAAGDVASSTKSRLLKERSSSLPARIIILPDSRARVVDEADLWHHHLKVSSTVTLCIPVCN